MKTRKSITELIERLENERNLASDEGAHETAEHRLGAAMLSRLGIPEGIDRGEAVERILHHWENSPIDAEIDPALEQSEPDADKAPQDTRRTLPRPIRGNIGEAPAADYDSMSAEQFRRLKKQLQKAFSDGRRVRL